MQLSSIQPASATPRVHPHSASDANVPGAGAASEVEASPEEDRAAAQQAKQDEAQRARDAQEVQHLRARDAEVRAHEQAHVAAGGRYTGVASLSYERGPDGRSYAVSGEVSVDASKISGDPQATIDKMTQVQRAALAPAKPSDADRRVASRAAANASEAHRELGEQRVREAQEAKKAQETPETQETQEATDGDSAARSGVDGGREREASTSSSRQQRAAAAYAPPGVRPGATVDRRY